VSAFLADTEPALSEAEGAGILTSYPHDSHLFSLPRRPLRLVSAARRPHAYGLCTTASHPGIAPAGVVLTRAVGIPVVVSRLNTLIASPFPLPVISYCPVESITSGAKKEGAKKGDPLSGVNAPALASTLNASMPPDTTADTYRNFPA